MANAGAKLSSFPEVNDIQTGDMFPLLSGGDTNAKIDYATLANAIIAKEVERATAAENKLESEKADKTTATSSADGLMSKSDKKAIDREFFRLLPKGATRIPANADLNSIQYLKVGNYYNPANAETQTLKNCPASHAFMMYVLSPLSEVYDDESTRAWVYRLRIFVECTGNVFIQYTFAGATPGSFDCGPWVKMTNSDDLGAVSKIINDHIANKSNPHAVTKAQVGLGSVANIDQSKAIKSITRSGTTFTATALDGTTTTFTQQDTNTTYSIATSSTDGLMSAADKKAVDREFFKMVPKGGTYIPANADLNSVEYLKVGDYYNSANAESVTIKNIPDKHAFIMYVLSPLSEVYDNESSGQWICRLRIFVTYTGSIYTQSVSSGTTKGVFTYEPWVKMTNSNDLGAVINEVTIKTVKVNGTALTPDSNKAVNVTVPTLANNATTTAGGMALDARMGKTLSDQASQLAKNTAQIETAGTATNAHSVGEYVMISNALYKVTAAVAKGDAWTIGTNVTAANIGSEIGSLKSDLANKLYPVGSIYISVNATNPAELFGGTWERIKDRFLLAAGDTYAAGSTGGEATHRLTIDEMPSHVHEMAPWMWAVSASFSTGTYHVPEGNNGNADPYNSSKSRQKQNSESTGGGLAHNNMPPYLAVYMWKRTA